MFFKVNADHGILRPAVVFRASDYIADCIWFAVPQPTEWQHIGNQINTAVIFVRSDFVNVCS